MPYVKGWVLSNTNRRAVASHQQAGAADPGLSTEVVHPRPDEAWRPRPTDIKAVAKEIKVQIASPHQAPPKRVCLN